MNSIVSKGKIYTYTLDKRFNNWNSNDNDTIWNRKFNKKF